MCVLHQLTMSSYRAGACLIYLDSETELAQTRFSVKVPVGGEVRQLEGPSW